MTTESKSIDFVLPTKTKTRTRTNVLQHGVESLSPIFCINLDKHVDRWTRTKAEIKRTFADAPQQPKLHRYSAVDRTNDAEPGRGCGESFCQLISKAKANKWPYVIICEDDVHFVPGAYSKLQKAMQCRPLNADVLLAGSYSLQFSKATVFNDHWLKLNGSYASHHFVIFFETAYDRLLQFKDFPNYRHFDRFVGNRFVAHGSLHVYVMWPMIARQYDGYSTTMKRVVKYNTVLWARKHHLLWFNEKYHADILAKNVPIIEYSEEKLKHFENDIRQFNAFHHEVEIETHSNFHSQSQDQDQDQEQEQNTTPVESDYKDVQEMSLYWYGMPTLFSKHYQSDNKRTRNTITFDEFIQFRELLQEYYNYVPFQKNTHQLTNQSSKIKFNAPFLQPSFIVDIPHLVLAYKNMKVLDQVLKQRFSLSLTEFKDMRNRYSALTPSVETV